MVSTLSQSKCRFRSLRLRKSSQRLGECFGWCLPSECLSRRSVDVCHGHKDREIWLDATFGSWEEPFADHVTMSCRVTTEGAGQSMPSWSAEGMRTISDSG